MPRKLGTQRPLLNAKGAFANADRAAIREQMERILESPLFKQSKRYPLVLRYLVDRALDGSHQASLKERTIGVEVLGHDPDYDTNSNPTVRVVAGEIRKRLIAYYQEPGHESEIRIELPHGAYTPEFTAPYQVEAPSAVRRRRQRNLLWAVGATLSAALLCIGWRSFMPPRTALDQFWDPVLRGSPSVLLCVGERHPWGSSPALEDRLAQQTVSPPNPSSTDGSANDMRRFITTQSAISIRDVIALTGVTDYLQSKGIRHSIRVASSTSLQDLRQGPAILIGSYNNYWTTRLGGDLRFRFRTGVDELGWIEDAENPSKREWVMKTSTPYTDITADFGLITRVADASTGRMVVSVAGLTGIGTAAAGEFLVNPAGWDSVAKQAPKGWDQKNLQVVIMVRLINGNYGPPSVLAAHFW
jgi:hypothetical protein